MNYIEYPIEEELEEAYKEIKRLKEANKILEENWEHYMMRCGKAIEYIEKYVSVYDMEGDLRARLLSILKGEDNE